MTTLKETVTNIAIRGSLACEGVTKLEEVCDSIEGELSLDLTRLSWVDPDSKEALGELAVRDPRLLRASPFFRLLLGQVK